MKKEEITEPFWNEKPFNWKTKLGNLYCLSYGHETLIVHSA